MRWLVPCPRFKIDTMLIRFQLGIEDSDVIEAIGQFGMSEAYVPQAKE